MFLIQELAIIRVPRRSLLHSTATALGLTLHGSGYEGGATRNVVAWVGIDLPRRSGEVHARRRVFRGQPSHTLAAAEESASQSVLDYLCTHCNIAIDDYNYGSLTAATSSLAAAQQWIHTKEWQTKMAKQETFRTQKEHGRRMKIFEKICAKFMDILPF